MRTEKFEGTVAEYQGSALATPITYSGDVSLYENVNEARNTEDWLSDSEILRAINSKKLAAAKASKYQEVTKPLKEAYEKSPEFKRKNLVASIMASGKNQAEAEALADSIMGK